MPMVVATITTQLSMNAGLKAWSNPATIAVKEEMKQLHTRDTFRHRHWKSLTPEEKEQRTVTGCNKQHGYIDKSNASSPTVSTQTLLLTCVVEAHKGRDVMTVDIPNAFIQTCVQDPQHIVLMKIKGYLAELLLEIAPEVYNNYIHVDKKGIPVIIAECWNAIYGTMIAGLLYYNKFCGTYVDWALWLTPMKLVLTTGLLMASSRLCVSMLMM
jgi:hypothetical protein